MQEKFQIISEIDVNYQLNSGNVIPADHVTDGFTKYPPTDMAR